MKILIIGGAGYIGSHVTEHLIEKRADVWILDNFSTGCRENVLAPEKCYEGDILDKPFLDRVFSKGWDAIIHLAAFKSAGDSMIDPQKYANLNISGSIAILNGMVQHNIPAIVFSSTAAVYGEPQYLPVDENHPTNPANFYGFTKLQVERTIDWYARLKGLRYACLRYFNAAGYSPDGSIYGVEQNPQNLLSVIMEVAIGRREKFYQFGDDWDTPDGTCIRDFIHVTDLASAHGAALEKILAGEPSFTLNLGSEAGLSVQSIINSTEKCTGLPLPVEVSQRRPGDIARSVACAKKAKSILGWKPKHSSVDTIVSSTWKAYLKFFGKDS